MGLAETTAGSMPKCAEASRITLELSGGAAVRLDDVLGRNLPTENEMVKANAVEVGEIHTVDDPEAMGGSQQPQKCSYGMLLQFESAAAIRQAMADGKVEFTVFGA